MISLNEFYLAENLEFLQNLESNLIDLIYIDPPFHSQEDYIEFSDKWQSITGYIGYIRERIIEMYRVLKDTGSFYIQCDNNAKYELKLLLDRIFGRERFQGEIIWNVKSLSGFKTQKKGWIRQHDTIFYYTKSRNFTFNKQYLPYSEEYIKKMFRYRDENNRLYRKRRNGKQYLDKSKGVPLGDVWNDIYSFQTRTNSKEYLGYPTQKPEQLLERIILSSSNEGDLVADFFCGSGTTLIMAKKLNRRWLGIDNNLNAIKLCKGRLEVKI